MNKKKTLGSSIVAIALSASLIAGSTFALFTSESKVNIAVTSGKVDVTAEIQPDTLEVYAFDGEGEKQPGTVTEADGTKQFPILNAGGAKLDPGDGVDLSISQFVPGEGVELDIQIQNDSTIAAKYQFGVVMVPGVPGGDADLFSTLEISMTEEDADVKLTSNQTLHTLLSDWRELPAETKEVTTLHVVIEFPYVATDPALAGKECAFDFTVSAVQNNAKTTNPISVAADGTYQLTSETELKALGDIVQAGETLEDQTVELEGDVTVTGEWEPIGTSAHPFEADFNGNGHTITVNSTYDIAELMEDGTTIDLGLFGYAVASEITNVHAEGTFKLTGEITGPINLNIAGIYAHAQYGQKDETNVSRCTNSIDIDLSEVTIGTEITQINIMIGGICAQRSEGTISDCLNEGNITLPETLSSVGDDVLYTIYVGGIIPMGSLSGGSQIKPLKNVLNVGTMPESGSVDNPQHMLVAGGIFGLDLRSKTTLESIATSWFSLNSPVGGYCIDGVYEGNKLTAETVKKQETFVGFDFDTVWKMGTTHPELR